MIGCLTETTTCVVAKPLVFIILDLTQSGYAGWFRGLRFILSFFAGKHFWTIKFKLNLQNCSGFQLHQRGFDLGTP